MAAGMGRRIANITNEKPKCFLEIGGLSIIDQQVEYMESSGIEEIIIVTGYKKHLFEEKFKGKTNIKYSYNPFYSITNVLASFWFGMNCIKGDFIYTHADTYFEKSIYDSLLDAGGSVVLPVDFSHHDDEAMKVLLNPRGQVIEISKEIGSTGKIGEFIGVAKISSEILSNVFNTTQRLIENGGYNNYFESVLQEMITEDSIFPKVVDVSGKVWGEIDCEEDYLRTTRILKTNGKS